MSRGGSGSAGPKPPFFLAQVYLRTARVPMAQLKQHLVFNCMSQIYSIFLALDRQKLHHLNKGSTVPELLSSVERQGTLGYLYPTLTASYVSNLSQIRVLPVWYCNVMFGHILWQPYIRIISVYIQNLTGSVSWHFWPSSAQRICLKASTAYSDILIPYLKPAFAKL